MAEKPECSKKPAMTEEERIELCQKLDKELDEFIDGLEKKRYTDGWPEDRWEEEMDKHPFFMKTVPENGELSPLAEGLAKLKYDPEENTPLELANSYKEDGNFNFKHKNYRLAIIGYTEGIKVRCDNADMNAALYNNRAASHWFLRNFRSSLYDSEKALTFDPEHNKSRLRAAKAALEIGQYSTCVDHCQKLLEQNLTDTEVTELLAMAKKQKMLQERDERRKKKMNEKKLEQRDSIVRAILDRGIKISQCDDEDDIDLSKLEPTLPGAQDSIVHIENGVLRWPVLFLYPEYQTSDFVKACPENAPLIHQLEQLFPAPWDEAKKYALDNINVYYEGRDKMPHVINPNKNLCELLVEQYFELKAGTPAFFVLVRGSRHEIKFLETYVYSEGMKVTGDSAETHANTFNKRAEAHFQLKNYKAALSDSEKILIIDPKHYEARLRAAKSALEVAQYNTCIEHCQILLQKKPGNKEVLEIMALAKKKKNVQANDKGYKSEIDVLLNAVKLRGIKIAKCQNGNDINISKLEPTLPGARNAIVRIENGILKWPILFLYPEYETSDFVKACPEDVPLIKHLEKLFPAAWDKRNKYRSGNINVYYEGRDKMPHEADPTKKLGELLVARQFEVKSGTPAFFVLIRNSRSERKFLECYV